MDQYLSLKQKQELALKPKMLQSLKMLALPILELESYIKQELEANPCWSFARKKTRKTSMKGALNKAPRKAALPSKK
jgi:DNA-directed RNA polymerase specialized sigma54-like protein